MSRVARVLVVAVLVAGSMPARAELPAPELRIVQPTESVELGWYDRARLRMYLQQNVLACTLEAKRPLDGDVKLVLDVTRGKAKVTATAVDRDVRGLARCIRRYLADVVFPAPAPAPRWRWDATLRLGREHAEANVRESEGPIERLPAGRLFIENLVLAALERPAACMDRYLATPDAVSVVLAAKLATRDGTLQTVDLQPSTAVPHEVMTCIRQQLDAIAVPVPAPVSAGLRVAVLCPRPARDDGTPTVIMGR